MKAKILRVRLNDGTLKEVSYKPTPHNEQVQAVSRYMIDNEGWRPSEAAMTYGTASRARVRKVYQALVLLGKVKQK